MKLCIKYFQFTESLLHLSLMEAKRATQGMKIFNLLQIFIIEISLAFFETNQVVPYNNGYKKDKYTNKLQISTDLLTRFHFFLF